MSDLEILRRTIARELDTISQYEADAAAAKDPRVRKLLEHLAHEEKEHVAEGMVMLQAFDPRQAELAHHEAHFLEESARPDTGPVAPVPGESPAVFSRVERFTVGSLRPDDGRPRHTPPEAFGYRR